MTPETQDSWADTAIGHTIRRAREARGLEQSQLSDLLRDEGVNWSQGTISRVEQGKRPVRLTEAGAVAGVLGLLVDELVPYRGVSIGRELQALLRHGERLQRRWEEWHAELAEKSEQVAIYTLFNYLQKNPELRAIVNGTCLDLATSTKNRVQDMPAAMAFLAILEELLPDFQERDDLPDLLPSDEHTAVFVSPAAAQAWEALCGVFSRSFPNVEFGKEPLRRGERITVSYPDGEPA
ncbi:helix-turn-helix domain-containing protein [Kocuria sp. KH4]